MAQQQTNTTATTNVMPLKKTFHAIGLVGLILTLLLMYSNHLSEPDFVLSPYKWQILLALGIVVFVHYCYLGCQAFIQKQWWWGGALFIAPVPTYWLYFMWELGRPLLAKPGSKMPAKAG